jgi:hypothetical protein
MSTIFDVDTDGSNKIMVKPGDEIYVNLPKNAIRGRPKKPRLLGWVIEDRGDRILLQLWAKSKRKYGNHPSIINLCNGTYEFSKVPENGLCYRDGRSLLEGEV